MDNCWDYHDGGAEEWMGKALAEGGRRDKVFLMTKVCGRTAKEAQSNLEDSLRRLKTDRIDLWQFHEIVYDNDPDWIFAADGAFQAGLKALKEGKVRYLGFTGHKDPIIHLKMLEHALRVGERPDAAQRDGRALPQLPEASPAGPAPAQHRRPRHEEPGRHRRDRESRRAFPSRMRSATSFRCRSRRLVSGIDSEKVLDQNLKIVREFQPMTAEEKAAIDGKTLAMAGDGRFELFKSSKMFDGPVHRKAAWVFNPGGLTIVSVDVSSETFTPARP